MAQKSISEETLQADCGLKNETLQADCGLKNRPVFAPKVLKEA